MSALRNEILEHFMSYSMGIRPLEISFGDYRSFTIKDEGIFGVAIPNINNIEIIESFENVELKSIIIAHDGIRENFLILTSSQYTEKLKFSHICEDFVRIGENNNNREQIIKDPYSWWLQWGELLGNVKSNKTPYAILAELWTYLYEVRHGNRSITWEGSDAKNHDFESNDYNIEVKSSVSLFNEEITVSNQFQLKYEKELYIYFIILQDNRDGISIDNLISKLVEIGVDSDMLEQKMKNSGMIKGSEIRKMKYKILESRRYLVDSNFPVVDSNSFKNGIVPKGIKKISYIVDLVNIPYKKL